MIAYVGFWRLNHNVNRLKSIITGNYHKEGKYPVIFLSGKYKWADVMIRNKDYLLDQIQSVSVQVRSTASSFRPIVSVPLLKPPAPPTPNTDFRFSFVQRPFDHHFRWSLMVAGRWRVGAVGSIPQTRGWDQA